MINKRRSGHEEVTNHSRGLQAEGLASDYLEGKGYKILQTRYKTKFGEIDIIAMKASVVCFVEVKSRNNKGDALESVTPRIQKRIEHSALFFLSEYPHYQDYDLRFDVIAVTPPFHITHLDNAWEARS